MDQQQPSAIVDDAQQQQPISDHHRPVAVPVPSTRPPSFATYPPSVYHPPPSSVQSYSHRQQQHQYQPSERLETHHEGLSPSSSSVLQVPIIHQLPAHQLQRIIPYSPSWHKTKIIIRSLTCLWEFIIIVLCVITVIRFSPSNWDDRGIQAWNAVLPIVAVLILYDIVELGTFCLRWRIKRGLHPAVTVTADLLCLMAVVLGLTFNLHNASITSGGYYGVMVLSCEGILGLIFVGHLVLFVRACVETRQRHKSKESTGLAYVYSPAGGKPFPILAAPGAPGKDLGAAGSEAGWTATTVNGFESSAQQQQQFQQSQQHLPVQAVPLQRMVISPSLGRSPTYYTSSVPPSEANWENTAGLGNGFEGYRGPEVNNGGSSSSSAAAQPMPPLDVKGDITAKGERRNQKEIIPPEIIAEFYDRIAVTPTEPMGSYGHERIRAGGSSGYPADKKGKY